MSNLSFNSDLLPEPYELNWNNKGHPVIENKPQEVRIAYIIANQNYIFL